MTLYTVVACPGCKYARVVPRTPERTTCGRCQSSIKFDKLNHYYQTEDKDAAARVRAAVRARIHDAEERFESAVENGEILTEVESVVSDDEYLREKGADVEAINEAEERAESGTNDGLSNRGIMQRAFEHHADSRESVLDFAESNDVSRDWANRYLNKALSTGELIGPRNGPFRRL